MIPKQTILTARGRNWQHRLLMSLVKRKDFPTRLRILHFLRRAFNLGLLKYETPSGLQLLLDFDDYVQAQIYYNGNYEPLSVSVFKKLAKDAHVIMDLGAHIGQYALECAQDDIEKSKRILAVEVNPKTFTYLMNNIQLNSFSQVVPVLGALSNGGGLVNIDIPAYWNMGNTQIAKDEVGTNNYVSASLTIKEMADKYQLKAVDLVKLDVEGHEMTILEGFFDCGLRPLHIMFEFIPDIFQEAMAVVDLLRSKGYEITDVMGGAFKVGNHVIEQNLIAKRKPELSNCHNYE